MSENKISLKFISYEKDGDHVEYKIIAKDSNNETWQLLARYSTLRGIYRDLREKFTAEGLPDFPPKKYFGTMSENFITQRQKALENFFNNLLKKHRYDEMEPLKNWIESTRQSLKKETKQDNQKGLNSDQTRQDNHDKKAEKDKLINLEKVIGNFKNEFFDLNDTFNPPDEDELRKKKNKYNFKVDFGPTKNLYELPVGFDKNLVSIQDKTLPSTNPSIALLLENTLQNLREGINKINMNYDQPIVVNLD